MKPTNQEMDYQFECKMTDNTQQNSIRLQYQSLYWHINNLPTGPEKSVAARKLLESLDAALRCVQP